MTSLLRAVGFPGITTTCLAMILFGISAVLTAPFSTCGSTGYGRHFLASLCSSGAPPRPVLLSSSDALRHRSTSTPVHLWRLHVRPERHVNESAVAAIMWPAYPQPALAEAANIQHFQRPEYAAERSDLTASVSVLLAFDLFLYYGRSAYCSASTRPTCSTF